MHIFDGFKTYLGAAMQFVAALVPIIMLLNAGLVNSAFGVAPGSQLGATIQIIFLLLPAIPAGLTVFGRIDAQRKINEAGQW